MKPFDANQELQIYLALRAWSERNFPLYPEISKGRWDALFNDLRNELMKTANCNEPHFCEVSGVKIYTRADEISA